MADDGSGNDQRGGKRPKLQNRLVQMGRPLAAYDEGVARRLLERVAEGENILTVCQDDDMPSWNALIRWRIEDATFAARYAKAREASAEALEMRALMAAGAAVDKDTAAAARVQAETYKWAASKRHPRQYGDRIDVNHAGAVAHVPVPVDLGRVTPEQRRAIQEVLLLSQPAPVIEHEEDPADDA